MRRVLSMFGGTLVAAGAVVLTAIACGTGDLAYLTEGDGATEPSGDDDDPGDPCKHARPPKPPPKSDDQTALTISFASRDMRLDTGVDPASGLSKPQGLDLDNTCTCGVADAAPSCKAPPLAPVTCDKVRKVEVDGGDASVIEDGRDNVAGDLLAVALTRVPKVLGPDAIRDRMAKGYYAILFSITEWNGKPDDDQVGVSIVMSPGADNGKDENNAIIPPAWEGSDRWAVEVGSIRDGKDHLDQECEQELPVCDPIAVDFNGYVSGGTLVANFKSVPFAFGDGASRISIPFSSATLVAKITGKSPKWFLDGELSGRWPAEAIVHAVGNIAIYDDDDPDAGVTGLCKTDETFDFFRQSVCLSVDLASTKDEDNQGKDCRTMSQSVHFKAEVAHLGKVKQSEAETNNELCPKDKVLDCADLWKR